MAFFVLDFPRAQRRRVICDWLVAVVLASSALALFSTLWIEQVDADAETIAVAVAVLLVAFPVPVAILVAWRSTFFARVAVTAEQEDEGGVLPPPYSPNRQERRSGRILARSWRRLESLARSQGIPGLEALGIGSVRDASRPTFEARHGLAVVEGLLQALSRSAGVVDEEVVSDLRNIHRQLAARSRDKQRFSLVMSGRW